MDVGVVRGRQQFAAPPCGASQRGGVSSGVSKAPPYCWLPPCPRSRFAAAAEGSQLALVVTFPSGLGLLPHLRRLGITRGPGACALTRGGGQGALTAAAPSTQQCRLALRAQRGEGGPGSGGGAVGWGTGGRALGQWEGGGHGAALVGPGHTQPVARGERAWSWLWERGRCARAATAL